MDKFRKCKIPRLQKQGAGSVQFSECRGSPRENAGGVSIREVCAENAPGAGYQVYCKEALKLPGGDALDITTRMDQGLGTYTGDGSLKRIGAHS